MTLIVSIDVGKTHTRLAIIDPHTGTEIRSCSRDNHSVETPLGRQLDIGAIEQWVIGKLRNEPERHGIAAIVPIAHGAAAVLVDERNQILAAPDYEDSRFEEVQHEYARERDPFDQTYSPRLPRGLNLARQLYYLEQQQPKFFAKVKRVLTYPQFWAWRLSGIMASEVTSLGCHTDLWRPCFSNIAQMPEPFSPLARKREWHTLFPPRRFAGECLGHAEGPLASAAELPRNCRIMCGIHDSNASYLRYLLERRDTPFAVISSGTWTVVMANKAPLDTLRPERDMLANVDAFGSPVATARFMGGREYEALVRPGHALLPNCRERPALGEEPIGDGNPINKEPTIEAVKRVIDTGAFAFPSFASGGPFPNAKGHTINTTGLSGSERAALASLYLALICDLLLESLRTQGDIIVDGPLASNSVFPALLASLRPRSAILIDERRSTGTAICYLAGYTTSAAHALSPCAAIELSGLHTYQTHWLSQLMH